MTAPICCGSFMTTTAAFVSGRVYHACQTCHANDYGWWRWTQARSTT